MRSDFYNNATICDRFDIVDFTSGNEEDGISPFGVSIPTPWDIMNSSLKNSVTHVSTSGPHRNGFYYCDIPVMGLIPELASKWLYASCAARMCEARVYL